MKEKYAYYFPKSAPDTKNRKITWLISNKSLVLTNEIKFMDQPNGPGQQIHCPNFFPFFMLQMFCLSFSKLPTDQKKIDGSVQGLGLCHNFSFILGAS